MAYWRDKVAVVTGGSAGLGFALATALAHAGARVVLVGRDPARLAAAAERLQERPGAVSTYAVDITCEADVPGLFSHVVEQHGRLDALLNSAGLSDRGLLVETPLSRLRALWELNFLAGVHCSQLAAPHLVAERGHLVFIGSLASKTAPRFLGAYPTSKFPVVAAAQQFRLELGPQGLHVLLVCPGPLAREDAGQRYATAAQGLPPEAARPGGGAKLRGIDPHALAQRVLRACERRELELVVPAKARLLFVLSQLAPRWGDWLLLKKTR